MHISPEGDLYSSLFSYSSPLRRKVIVSNYKFRQIQEGISFFFFFFFFFKSNFPVTASEFIAVSTTGRLIELKTQTSHKFTDITDEILPSTKKPKTVKSIKQRQVGILTEDGEVYEITNGKSSKLIPRTEQEHVIQLETGFRHFLALTNTHRVLIWGDYRSDVFGFPLSV